MNWNARFYNHLAAAQHPSGSDWCYYTALEGRKPYDKGINCCHSSGPRGMALAPQAAYLRGHDAGRDVLLVSTLESSHATLELGGQAVTVRAAKRLSPRAASPCSRLRLPRPATFAVRVRVPAWASPLVAAGRRRQHDFAGRLGKRCRPGSGKTASGSSLSSRSPRGSCSASTAMRAGPRRPGDRSCWPAASGRTRPCHRSTPWDWSSRSRRWTLNADPRVGL